MGEDYPEAPSVDPSVTDSIAEHADRVAAWLEREQAQAAAHGHSVDSLHEHISGWRYVADVMREWNG